MHIYEGHFNGSEAKVAIVISRFNELLGKNLLEGALDAFKRHGVSDKNISIAWVPGIEEVPLVAQTFAQTKRFDGILCISVVIRGETAHFDWVISRAVNGISKVSLDHNLPVVSGTLTTENLEQTIERAGTKSGNKGYDGAVNLLEMINLMKQLHGL